MAMAVTGHVKKFDHHFSANTMGRHIDDAWVNGRWASAQGGQMASFKNFIFISLAKLPLGRTWTN